MEDSLFLNMFQGQSLSLVPLSAFCLALILPLCLFYLRKILMELHKVMHSGIRPCDYALFSAAKSPNFYQENHF